MGKRNLIFHLCNANCLGFDYSRLIDCQTRLLSSGNVCKFACQMRQREQAGRERVVQGVEMKKCDLIEILYNSREQLKDRKHLEMYPISKGIF